LAVSICPTVGKSETVKFMMRSRSLAHNSKRRDVMRKLFTAAVLTAALATPALAQNSRHYQTQHGAAWDAVNGVEGYAGQDPDPNVRLELRRDFYRE
jgi:hypothetical protein